MSRSKPWYTSKTIWGGVASIVAGGAGLVGLDIGTAEQAQIASHLSAVAGVAGGLIAMYGRAKAVDKLTGRS